METMLYSEWKCKQFTQHQPHTKKKHYWNVVRLKKESQSKSANKNIKKGKQEITHTYKRIITTFSFSNKKENK